MFFLSPCEGLLGLCSSIHVGIPQVLKAFFLWPFHFSLHIVSQANVICSNGFNCCLDSNDSQFQIIRLDRPRELQTHGFNFLVDTLHAPQTLVPQIEPLFSLLCNLLLFMGSPSQWRALPSTPLLTIETVSSSLTPPSLWLLIPSHSTTQSCQHHSTDRYHPCHHRRAGPWVFATNLT